VRLEQITARALAVVVGVVLLIVGLSLLVHRCDVNRSRAAQSRVNASQAQAASNSAADAINAVGAANGRETASESLTRSNEQQIRGAPGANDKVNPAVRDAGIAALCRRQSYANDPRCHRP
jgi:hypothetical protein